MNNKVLVFNKNNGRIICVNYISALLTKSMETTDDTDFFVVTDESFDPANSYFLHGVLNKKPIQQTTLSNIPVIANGVDCGVLQYLPTPCTVSMNGEVYEVTDGLLELSFDTPGEYQVTVSAFPYLDKTFTIEAI